MALSSCEAEVMAASEGIKEALLSLLVWEATKLKSKWTAVRHTHSSIDEELDA